ncbi:hypothetical protein J7K92_02060 [bacterium]|nr:hypothetical protein [bacterium]
MELSSQTYWKAYQKLPPVLKEMIFSPDTAEAIWGIAKICEIDRTATLAKIIGDVLSGFLPPEKFKEAAQKQLGLDEEKAKKLEIYVNHYIFDLVRDELNQLYAE